MRLIFAPFSPDTYPPSLEYLLGSHGLFLDRGGIKPAYIVMVKTESRRQQILNLLEETGTLNVSDLADRFGVSLVTIRSDLDELEGEGLLQRTSGGAIFSDRSRFNRSFRERVQAHRQQKQAIAAAAIDYIKDGDTIILDAGTTIPALAQLLKEQVKSVFIITCSVPVALELSSAGYDILLLGGMVRNKSLALLGRETLAILERYRADKAFVGSSKAQTLEAVGAKLRIVNMAKTDLDDKVHGVGKDDRS